MSLKILAFLRHYPPPSDGGAYQYNRHVVEELVRQGCNVTVITHPDATPLDSENLVVLPVNSVKTGRHVYHSGMRKLADLIASVFALRRALSRADFDWVLSDTGYLQNLAVFLGSFPASIHIAALNFSEEISTVQKTTRLRAWLQRWLLKRNACNIVIARSTESMLKDLGVKTSIILVYPCVEQIPALDKTAERKKLALKYSLPGPGLIVGFLGRHIRRKGVHNLVKAVAQLRASGCTVSLLIAGQGPESPALRELIRENGWEEFCKLTGLLPEEEKAAFLSGLDVFAMPNYDDPGSGDSEGFGIVFLEAAGQGTPVIGGKDGGAPEAISAGRNGFIVDGQGVDSIRDAIEQYYRDPVLRLAHGEYGKLWVKRFIWPAQVQPLVQFMERL